MPQEPPGGRLVAPVVTNLRYDELFMTPAS
jgi:hypothetical protein